MKKCPYCNHENDDQRTICERCMAAIPKILSEDTKKNSETDRATRNRKRSEN